MVSIGNIKPQVYHKINRQLVESDIYSTDNREMKSALGKVIFDKLRELEKTQSWLADQIPVSVNAVSKWIRTGKISRENLVAVAGVLGLSTDELVGLDESGVVEAQEPGLELVFLTRDEIRLVTMYRQATNDGRKIIEINARNAPKELLPQKISVLSN